MLAARPVAVMPFDRSWSSISTPNSVLGMPCHSGAEPDRLESDSGFVLLTYTNMLSEPPASVLSFLQRLSKPTGVQLFDQLKQALKLLRGDASGQVTSDTSKLVGYALRDVHATILEVDDDLTDCQSSPEDAEPVQLCRQWLKQLQAFVLGLQKDVEYLTNFGQPMTDQQQQQWARLMEHAHAKLELLVPAAVQDSQAVSQRPGSVSPPTALAYRPVCSRSRLSYSRHWAGKFCL